MLDFIPAKSNGLNRASIVVPEFTYVQKGLVANLDKAVAHQSKTEVKLDNSHWLRVLFSVLPAVDPTVSEKEYYNSVVSLLPSITSALGLVSDNTLGFSRRNVLYGSVFEIWVSVMKPYNTQEYPIRVLRHPFTYTNLPHFTGNVEYDEYRDNQFAVIEIDVPRLSLQYRKWALLNAERTEERKETLSFFISTYVMPKILESHMNIAIFNCYSSRLMGEPTVEDKADKDILLIDYMPKLKDAVDDVIDTMLTTDLDFRSMMESMALLPNTDMTDAVGLVGQGLMPSYRWATLIANAPLLKFWLFYRTVAGNNRDNDLVGKLKLSLRLVKNDASLRSRLLEDDMDAVSAELEYLNDLF